MQMVTAKDTPRTILALLEGRPLVFPFVFFFCVFFCRRRYYSCVCAADAEPYLCVLSFVVGVVSNRTELRSHRGEEA